MIQKSLNKSEVIKNANLPRTYGYQILDGSKTPGRDKVISLSLAVSATLDEAQRLLTLSGHNILYARDPRDSVLIFSINKHLSVFDANSLLYEQKLALLE